MTSEEFEDLANSLEQNDPLFREIWLRLSTVNSDWTHKQEQEYADDWIDPENHDDRVLHAISWYHDLCLNLYIGPKTQNYLQFHTLGRWRFVCSDENNEYGWREPHFKTCRLIAKIIGAKRALHLSEEACGEVETLKYDDAIEFLEDKYGGPFDMNAFYPCDSTTKGVFFVESY